MACVEVRLTALPAHVRTARLVASAVARRAGVPPDVLDEVRLAVGEACSRAVDLHQRFAADVPVVLEMTDEPSRFVVSVIDAGPSGEDVPDLRGAGIGSGVFDPATIAGAVPRQPPPAQWPAASGSGAPALDFLPAGFGLAVLRGLVEDVDITPQDGGVGTRVCMSWPAEDPAARSV